MTCGMSLALLEGDRLEHARGLKRQCAEYATPLSAIRDDSDGDHEKIYRELLFRLIGEGDYVGAISVLSSLLLKEQHRVAGRKRSKSCFFDLEHHISLQAHVLKKDYVAAASLEEEYRRCGDVDMSGCSQRPEILTVGQLRVMCNDRLPELCSFHSVRLLAVARIVKWECKSSFLAIYVGDDEGYVACVRVFGMLEIPSVWFRKPLVDVMTLKPQKWIPGSESHCFLHLKGGAENISLSKAGRQGSGQSLFAYSVFVDNDFCSMR